MGYELKFWNFITGRIGKIIAPNGFKCGNCGKLIEGDFRKTERLFEIYHPKCFKKSRIKIVGIDEIKS